MSIDLVHLFQGAIWCLFTVFCGVFGYATINWIINTYFPARFITVNHYHNDKLVSSHKVDLHSAEPLVRQLRKIQEEATRG
ncbi:hypothetical protein [Photorhabdus akhurstii]|nr:hypothetical protein [Photorhabdus akhurstii]